MDDYVSKTDPRDELIEAAQALPTGWQPGAGVSQQS